MREWPSNWCEFHVLQLKCEYVELDWRGAQRYWTKSPNHLNSVRPKIHRFLTNVTTTSYLQQKPSLPLVGLIHSLT
jgi:hypothetical protein